MHPHIQQPIDARTRRLFAALTLLFVLLGSLAVPPVRAAGSPGSVDLTFDTSSGPNDRVRVLAVQTDGKILIGGDFTQVNGTPRNHIARLNTNGSLDTAFAPNGATGAVTALTVQTDGKALFGATATMSNTLRSSIARVNANGSPDANFSSNVSVNGYVYALAVQADGKIVIGGDFTEVSGSARNRIARLTAGGTLDTSFDPGLTPNNTVNALAVQADGKIVIGGDFTAVNGTPRNRIARLSAGGTLDTSFNTGSGLDGSVNTLALQSDGKVVIGGSFRKVNGVARGSIARLNANGSLDTNFDSGGTDKSVASLALQADNKVVLVGDFSQVNAVARAGMARLNANGSIDSSYDPGSGVGSAPLNQPLAVAVQADNKAVVGGYFWSINSVPRRYVARLEGGSLSNPVAPTLTALNGTRGKPGSYFAFTAQGFQPNEAVNIKVDAYTAMRLKADASGKLSFALFFGPNTPARSYTVTAVAATPPTRQAQLQVTLDPNAALLPLLSAQNLPQAGALPTIYVPVVAGG